MGLTDVEDRKGLLEKQSVAGALHKASVSACSEEQLHPRVKLGKEEERGVSSPRRVRAPHRVLPGHLPPASAAARLLGAPGCCHCSAQSGAPSDLHLRSVSTCCSSRLSSLPGLLLLAHFHLPDEVSVCRRCWGCAQGAGACGWWPNSPAKTSPEEEGRGSPLPAPRGSADPRLLPQRKGLQPLLVGDGSLRVVCFPHSLCA